MGAILAAVAIALFGFGLFIRKDFNSASFDLNPVYNHFNVLEVIQLTHLWAIQSGRQK